MSGSVQRSVGSNPPGVTFVDSVSVTKSHIAPTPIQPKSSIEHLQALTNATDKDAKIAEEMNIKEEERKMAEEEDEEGGEEGAEDKSQSPPKRNLWWLKKKRRKRTRLTYIKSKYRRKDEEGAPSTSEVAAMEDEAELDDLPKSPSGERPKRGRPPKGIGFRFKTESFSNSDPDWDETEERRRVKPVVKKRKGRMKKGIIFLQDRIKLNHFLSSVNSIAKGIVNTGCLQPEDSLKYWFSSYNGSLLERFVFVFFSVVRFQRSNIT